MKRSNDLGISSIYVQISSCTLRKRVSTCTTNLFLQGDIDFFELSIEVVPVYAWRPIRAGHLLERI